MVSLKNVSRRMFVASLPHEQACSEHACGCESVSMITRELDPVSGDYGTRVYDKPVCASLHIAPGETVAVEDSIENVRAVKKAVAGGVLKVVE